MAKLTDHQKLMYLEALGDNKNTKEVCDYDEDDPESIREHAERVAAQYGVTINGD